MKAVENFLLVSREDSSSREKVEDLLSLPKREVLGGKRFVRLQDGSVKKNRQQLGSHPQIVTADKIGSSVRISSLFYKKHRGFRLQAVPSKGHYSKKMLEIYRHVHRPSKYVQQLSAYRVHSKCLKKLSECACVNTAEFNRLAKSRRDNLENEIVNQLSKTHTDRNNPLHLLSLGSGELLSDFFTLEKLIAVGFRNITLDCVDPYLNFKGIQQMRKFFEDCPEVSIKINGYKNIDNVPQERKNYSAVLAVDYEADIDELKSITDLMKARRRLSPHGFLALGIGNEDTLSGPQMESVTLTPYLAITQSLVQDFAGQLPDKDELWVSIPSMTFDGVVHVMLYALALAVEKSGKSYRQIHIGYHGKYEERALRMQEIGHSNSESKLITDKEFEESLRKYEESLRKDDEKHYLHFKKMLEVFFPNSKVELCLHPLNQKYDLFFTGPRESELQAKKYFDFLSTDGKAYILLEEGGFQRQNSDPQTPPVSFQRRKINRISTKP